MKAYLTIDGGAYQNLMAHLLPPNSRREQAAFLFAHAERNDRKVWFTVVGIKLLCPEDFTSQEGDYLEMADATQASLIKQAYDMDASLIEIHSHLGPWPAAFSPTDRYELRETVAHMWWRLDQRPYLALVVAKSGFDALVWINNPAVPQVLDGLLVGGQTLTPANSSLWRW